MTKILSFFITVIMLIEALPVIGQPVLTVDASEVTGTSTTKATGFLYGFAENEVPSSAITDALKVSSVSQKVPGGLQHPIGDIDHVKDQLDSCEYIVTYLQDAFDTWYYCNNEIMEMRKNGTYDWKEFLYERYLPIVEEKVRHIESQSYSDRIVYCIYNECDNAVWFGNYVDGTCQYDDIGRQNFYEAWKITYDFVKSIAPDAKIGGPGFCDYETVKQEGFMKYTVENNCVPQIMIWHELAWWSIPDWNMHYEDYRRLEEKYGIDELDIIVTEYGEPEECGNPADMLHYIIAMEKTGIWGNMAYWRLSNNLNDTTADDNSPNSNWWLYRRYAEMKGQQSLKVSSKTQNNYNHKERLDAHATLTDNGEQINMLVTGSEKKASVKLTSLDKTALMGEVDITVECVYYEGLSGIVSEPTVLRQYTAKADKDLNLSLPATDTDAVYFVTVKKHEGDIKAIRNTNIPVRYEFEEGKLLGDAYTYDSWYATTGETSGMVGGMEKDGDGVKVTFTTAKSGTYDLDIIYGKHNDSGKPQERDYAKVRVKLDGKEEIISLENTIKSEYTSKHTLTKDLCPGIHTIEFYNNEGTYVLDSMLVSLHEENNSIPVLEDGNNKYFAVAPYDGYYNVITGKNVSGTVDGAKAQFNNGSYIYLRRGLNEIKLTENTELVICKAQEETASQKFTASDFTLDGAVLNTDKYGTEYIDGISSIGGSASLKVNAPESGSYRITVNYANNQEGGYHDYNVDLIEAMMTVSVNGKNAQDIFLRNTYSKFTYKTMTFNVELTKGENVITVYNSGSTLFNNQTSFAPQIESFTVSSVNA